MPPRCTVLYDAARGESEVAALGKNTCSVMPMDEEQPTSSGLEASLAALKELEEEGKDVGAAIQALAMCQQERERSRERSAPRWTQEMEDHVEERVREAEAQGEAVDWVAMVKRVKQLAEEKRCKVIVEAVSIRAHYVNVMCPKDDTIASAINTGRGSRAKWTRGMEDHVAKRVREAAANKEPVDWAAMVERVKQLAEEHNITVIVDAASIRAHCVNVMCPKDGTLAWAKNKKKVGGSRTKWTPGMENHVEECVRAAEKGGKAVDWAAMVKRVKQLAEEKGCKVVVDGTSIRNHCVNVMCPQDGTLAWAKNNKQGGGRRTK